jgi:hypothetical protein
MKTSLAVRAAMRHTRQEQRPPRKVCPYCFERDHIGGRNHVPHITVETCQFHHALRTAERLDAGADMGKQPTTALTVAMALRSLAVTLDALMTALGQAAEALRWCANKLVSEGGAQ